MKIRAIILSFMFAVTMFSFQSCRTQEICPAYSESVDGEELIDQHV